MSPRIKSIQDLRKELAAKERQLDKVLTQRKKLVAKLKSIDKRIAALGGEVPSSERRSKPGPKPKIARKKRRTPKRANSKPLVDYIKQVLAKMPKGMRAKDVAPAVKAAGYATRSKDFYGIVAAALRDTEGIKRVTRGVYKMAR